MAKKNRKQLEQQVMETIFAEEIVIIKEILNFLLVKAKKELIKPLIQGASESAILEKVKKSIFWGKETTLGALDKIVTMMAKITKLEVTSWVNHQHKPKPIEKPKKMTLAEQLATWPIEDRHILINYIKRKNLAGTTVYV